MSAAEDTMTQQYAFLSAALMPRSIFYRRSLTEIGNNDTEIKQKGQGNALLQGKLNFPIFND